MILQAIAACLLFVPASVGKATAQKISSWKAKKKRQKPRLNGKESKGNKTLTFHYTDWFIGIVVLDYYNPHKTQ